MEFSREEPDYDLAEVMPLDGDLWRRRAMTKIEWTDLTWNPWWGCSEIAPECGKHAPNGEAGVCWAALFGSRGLHPHFRGVAVGGKWTGTITPAHEKIWHRPYTWRRPKRVFTCSMSDFFHEAVPLEWLDEALDVIEATPHLTYQILSKRPGNIARKLGALHRTLPDNVWLGVTIGHVQSLPLLKPLRLIDASVRFLSCEPLLTPLVPRLKLDGIDWVIGGGQSGAGAAICDPEWMRNLRDLCLANGVPFFLKQWGTQSSNPTPRDQELDPKAKGGATLDGHLWRDFPRAM
jgi:protein gp37